MAIIVTYNPDLQRLRENLAAVEPQVDAIVLYDNGSHNLDDLEGLMDARPCIYKTSYANDGLSKALNTCCRAAEELGARYMLLLDQDSVAGAGMVAQLASAFTSGTGLACPQIQDRNKRESLKMDVSVLPVKRAITSGSLVSVVAWRAVGGFDERMFVDWVDYDFSANLRAHGFSVVRNNAAVLRHEMGRREYVASLPWVGGVRGLYRTNHSVDRQYDKARSQAILKLKYGYSRVGCEERAYIASIRARDLLLERGRMGILRAFIKGSRDGRRAYVRQKSSAHD